MFTYYFRHLSPHVISSITSNTTLSECFSFDVSRALGSGAVKSNLVIFGAEQNQNQESRAASRYFELYALAVNCGSAIAISIVPYVNDRTILTHAHYYILYTVVIVILAIALALFLLGWRYYLHDPTKESVIFHIFPVLFSACRSWYAFKKQRRTDHRPRTEREHQVGTPMTTFDRDLTNDDFEESLDIRESLPSILDYARAQYGGKCLGRHVSEVKALRNSLLVFALLVPFWLIEHQVSQNKIMSSIIFFSFFYVRRIRVFNRKVHI